jgi:NAD(P)-dependent dehydrogenase (short-subunit alcohol dehydrogenase family)
MKDFQNKVAVITGAASGFGREFANAASKLGMKLVMADVQQDQLDAAQAQLKEEGATVLAVHCDVSKGEDVQALADRTMAEYGAVHLLFNNAGVGAGGLIWENSVADWEWLLGVNLWGVIHGVHVFTPLMLECARRDATYQGHIINTASVAGLLNAPTMGIYNVSKHAVVSLSETLYHDLKLIDAPIGASVLCPYFVPTGIHKSERNRPQDLQNDEQLTVSQRASQAISAKAVTSGKMTAAQVVSLTFDAIRENQFYIYSHPETLESVAQRVENLVAAQNPTDPYDFTPQVKEALKAKLRSS